jgi:RNA recognition motif-containing protein
MTGFLVLHLNWGMSLERTSDEQEPPQPPREESPFFKISSSHDDHDDDESVKLFIGQVVSRVSSTCLSHLFQIQNNLDEETLQPFFEEFGPILEFSVIRDKATKFHRGREKYLKLFFLLAHQAAPL